MRSLKARLTLFLLLGIGVLFLLSGVVLQALAISRLQREFDQALEAKARALITLTKDHGGEVELDFADEFMPEFEAATEPEYFQIWLGDGSVLEKSRSTGAAELLRYEIASPTPRFRDLELLDGRGGRQVQIEFVPQLEDDHIVPENVAAVPDPSAARGAATPATVVVAKSRRRLDATIRSFRNALIGTAVVLMTATVVLVRVSLRLGFRPLRAVARQVDALDAESLDRRILAADTPAELQPLIGKLNGLLDRLDEAFHRERRLSTDIAHELRTPVAELRSLAEVGARLPDDREAALEFFDDVRQIAVRMERTIADLLSLARFEGGLEPVRHSDVEVRKLIDDVWSGVAAEAEGRNLELVCRVAPALWVRTDGEKLERILVNLLSNAVQYSPQGGTIRCRARREGGKVTLTVANSTDDLAPEDLPRMFDRFWRKDPARAGGRNAGLGMSLVRVSADLLGLDLKTSLDASKTFLVSLSAPAGGPS